MNEMRDEVLVQPSPYGIGLLVIITGYIDADRSVCMSAPTVFEQTAKRNPLSHRACSRVHILRLINPKFRESRALVGRYMVALAHTCAVWMVRVEPLCLTVTRGPLSPFLPRGGAIPTRESQKKAVVTAHRKFVFVLSLPFKVFYIKSRRATRLPPNVRLSPVTNLWDTVGHCHIGNHTSKGNGRDSVGLACYRSQIQGLHVLREVVSKLLENRSQSNISAWLSPIRADVGF
ncbi:hypothetical protein K449DRAFT_430682 [Hypoxylon sp. EC38]|nr:hypothetical protein K449DRAFT_430682 [Hypoxylon sp. EC38]